MVDRSDEHEGELDSEDEEIAAEIADNPEALLAALPPLLPGRSQSGQQRPEPHRDGDRQ